MSETIDNPESASMVDESSPGPSENTLTIPIPCNDEGIRVAWGRNSLLCCNRRFGDDDMCGERNRFQCQSCKRLQQNSRLDLLGAMFPSLTQPQFIAALRKQSGSLYAAIQYLVKLGAPHVEMNLAFPGTKPEGFPEPLRVVSTQDVQSVQDFLQYATPEMAMAALRRSSNNVEGAIHYILDTSEIDMMAATIDDAEKIQAYDRVQQEFLTKRNQAIQDIVNNEGPTFVFDATQPVNMDDTQISSRRLELAAMDGHLMVNETEQNGDENHGNLSCAVCASSIPGDFSGSYHCQLCLLCDGCVQSKVVYKCPKMGNGGHLHTCKLQPVLYGTVRPQDKCCNVNGHGCLERDNLAWYCQGCEFDVCSVCISQDVPIGFDRRLGRVFKVSTEEQEQEAAAAAPQPRPAVEAEETPAAPAPPERSIDDSVQQDGEEPEDKMEKDEVPPTVEEENLSTGKDEEIPPTEKVNCRCCFLPVNEQERFAAARWEGDSTCHQDYSPSIIVGTGSIGSTTVPEGRRRRQSESLPEFRASRSDTVLEGQFETAMGNFRTSKTVAACDAHHVEDLLRLAHGTDDDVTSRAVCRAVETGKMDVAGTLLLAHSYGLNAQHFNPKRKRDDGNEIRCFCGDIINEETAPDGAVGCLNGHAMHPSCAADHLLGGGHCPTCRSPLFLPKVSMPEVQSAKEFFQTELRRRREETEAKMKLEMEQLTAAGRVAELSIDDIVRICSDIEDCKTKVMEYPKQAGWCPEMANFCGSIGKVKSVVSVNGKQVAVQVQTQALPHSYSLPAVRFICRICLVSSRGPMCKLCFRCQACCQHSRENSTCPRSSTTLYWTPSTLTLIGRAGDAVMWDKSLADEGFITAAENEQHIVRLRAELKAVSMARATIQGELDEAATHAVTSPIVNEIKDEVSVPDWKRADHLLLLTKQWDDSESAAVERKKVENSIRQGDVDTAGRIVRHFNSLRMTEALKWADAKSKHAEYISEDYVKVDLLAWPCENAPKTGYCLDPNTRFLSMSEQLDNNGNLWLHVDQTCFLASAFKPGEPVRLDPFDKHMACKLINSRVSRGPDWMFGSQDGGATNVGIIVGARDQKVYVRWISEKQEANAAFVYRAGEDNNYDLVFADSPPPQGWLCTRAYPDELPVVRRGRSALRCSCCDDSLFPSRQLDHPEIRPVGKDISIGDTLLVAATRHPVQVVNSERDTVLCSISKDGTDIASAHIWYRRADLVKPLKDDSKNMLDDNDEFVLMDGKKRNRREMLLMFENEADAKEAWDKAKMSEKGNADEVQFASCSRGHPIHARCFQGSLFAGGCCPAPDCNEPLWIPKVRRLRREDDACSGANTPNEAIQTTVEVNDLVGPAALARARNMHGNVSISGSELKMCPACFAGPLMNQECDDMAAHHGQCVTRLFEGENRTRCNFSARRSEIASSLLQLTEDKKVADVLPKCQEHNVVVMFNGCMNCGHLFTDIGWDNLPKFDPTAKTMLDMDKEKRKMASLLAGDIRKEMALLEYERNALNNKWSHGLSSSVSADMSPFPSHSVDLYPGGGCSSAK